MRHSGSASAFAAKEGVSKKDLKRLFAGEYPLSWDTVSLIEGRIGLPRGIFVCVCTHDFDQLEQIGAEADLVRWIKLASNLYSGVPIEFVGDHFLVEEV